MQISGSGGLKLSLCLKTPTGSSSCSSSGLSSSITSSETQARFHPHTKANCCFSVMMCFVLLVDRGNDNWLLKYDCPMDSAANRVRIPVNAGVCVRVCVSSLTSIILTPAGSRLGACEESHHQAGSHRQRPGVPAQASGLLESL